MRFESDQQVPAAHDLFRTESAESPRPFITHDDYLSVRPTQFDRSSILTSDGQEAVINRLLSTSSLNNLYGGRVTDRDRATSDTQTDAQALEPREEQRRLLEDDIRKYGKEPGPVLTQLMRDNAVVAIGESHLSHDPQRLNAPELLRSVREGGATHLGIEVPQSARHMLDEFNRTGNLDVSQLPILLRDESYVNMLHTARSSGLKVFPMDAEQGASKRFRDQTMAASVRQVLDQPNQDPSNPNKVALWVGAWHVQDFSRIRQPGPNSSPTVVENLRQQNVKVASVSFQGPYPETVAGRIAANLNQPQIVSTREAANFGAHRDVLNIPFHVYGDHVIMYPSQRR